VLQFNGGTLAPTASVALNRTVSVASGGGVFNVGSGQTASIQNLTGTGTLTKRGGTLTLTGDSAYDGSLKIAENDFQVASGVTLSLGNGAGRSALSGAIGTSGTLVFNAVDSAAAISGTGALVKSGTGRAILTGDTAHTGGTTILGGDLQIGNFGTTSGSLSGNVVNQGTLTFARDNADVTFAGAISGSGQVEQLGNNVLSLTGSNSYLGGTALGGGTLNLGSAHAIGDSGTIDFGGGVLQFSAANTSDYSARFSTAAGQRYRIDTNGQEVTLASALSSAGGSLAKLGGGTLILSGSNGFDGGVEVFGGALSVAADSSLGAASGTVTLGGGTLRTTGNMDTARAIVLQSGGGTFDVANETYLTLEAPVSGTGGLSKIGTGYLTLAGAQTYSGSTSVQGGFLKIESGSLASSAVNLSGAAFLLSNSVGELAANITGSGTLARSGTGASVLTGSIGSGIAIQIDSGTLQVGNGGAAGEIQSDVVNNGTLSVSRDDFYYAGSISGSGAVANVGSGTFTLTGTSSIGTLSPEQGSTIIAGRVTSSQTSGIAATGGTALLAVSGSGANWTSQADTLIGDNGGAGSLIISNGATAGDTFSLVGRHAGSAGSVTVYNDSTWTHSAGLVIGMGGTGTMGVYGGQVSNADGTIGGDAGSSGKVRVSGSTSRWTSTSYLRVGDAGAGVLSVDQGGTVQVGVAGSGTITLGNAGSASGVLNIGGPAGQFSNVAGTIAAAEITGGAGTGDKVVNFNYDTETNYVFAPRLTGSLRVAHQKGDTTLSGSNTYTAGTMLTGGTLSISNDANLGAVSGTLTISGGTLHTSGTLALARSVQVSSSASVFDVAGQDDLTLSGTVSGAGGLTKTGSGRLTLANHNTYTGTTTVQAGRLSVNGYVAGSAAVQSGAALGGSGTIHGSLTAQAGGTVGPGNSPGLLTIDGNVTLNDQSILQMEFASTSLFDQISVGGLFAAGGILDLVILDGYTPEIGDTFTIFTAAAPNLGGTFSLTSNLGSGLAWDTSRMASSGVVEVVPEPGTWALFIVGGLLVAAGRRLKAEG